MPYEETDLDELEPRTPPYVRVVAFVVAIAMFVLFANLFFGLVLGFFD